MLVRCALGHKLAARPQLVERRPHPSGGDEVPLAFVQRERIPEVTDSLVAPSGQYADVTEVAERVRVPVEHLRLATEAHGLPGKTLPFGLRFNKPQQQVMQAAWNEPASSSGNPLRGSRPIGTGVADAVEQ